jgi:uncharacterized damage-inducible protein DinB
VSLAKNFSMLARYNQRMNEQLLTCCLALPKVSLEKETHSFFPNIISYWNHLIFGDVILLGRLAANGVAHLSVEDMALFPTPESPQDIYYHTLSDLAPIRRQLDQLIIRFCTQLTEDDCNQFITYTSTEGEAITKAVADVTQHIFNHQTHHRGQLTCVLSQCGVNYGCMDLPIIVPEGSQR